MLLVEKKYFFRNGLGGAFDWIGELTYGLYPVERNGKVGYVNEDGDIVIPIIYDKPLNRRSVYPLQWSDDILIALKKQGRAGVVKADGSVVIPFIWNNINLSKASEGFIPISYKGKWGFCTVEGFLIYPLYDTVRPFKQGYASVCLNDRWGMIEENGDLCIPPIYSCEINFCEGDDFTIVYSDGVSIIDERGHPQIINAEAKIISRKGYEILTGCRSIERVRKNTFFIKREFQGYYLESTKEFVPLSDGRYIGVRDPDVGEIIIDCTGDNLLMA